MAESNEMKNKNDEPRVLSWTEVRDMAAAKIDALLDEHGVVILIGTKFKLPLVLKRAKVSYE